MRRDAVHRGHPTQFVSLLHPGAARQEARRLMEDSTSTTAHIIASPSRTNSQYRWSTFGLGITRSGWSLPTSTRLRSTRTRGCLNSSSYPSDSRRTPFLPVPPTVRTRVLRQYSYFQFILVEAPPARALGLVQAAGTSIVHQEVQVRVWLELGGISRPRHLDVWRCHG
jgi:hypothetical protein